MRQAGPAERGGDRQGQRTETHRLKEALAEVTLESRLLKKSVIADGEDIA